MSERDDDMAELLKRAVVAYEALDPVERALHDDEQRRSFVRGQVGADPGPSVLASEVIALRAQISTLQAALQGAEGVRKAAIETVALLDVAISATTFTKPRAGQIIVNVERAQKVLDGLRAALSPPPAGQAE